MLRSFVRRESFTFFFRIGVASLAAGVANAGSVAIQGPDSLGRGLQAEYVLKLDVEAPSSGLPIDLTVTNPAVCVVSESELVAGSGSLSLTVEGWRLRERFWIQSLAAGSDDCQVHVALGAGAPAGWFAATPFDLPIVTARLRLRGVRAKRPNQEPSPIRVMIGVPGTNGSGLKHVQRISKGDGACTVSVCTGDPAVIDVLDGNKIDNDLCESATIDEAENGTALKKLSELFIAADSNLAAHATTELTASGACGDSDVRTVHAGPNVVTIRPPHRGLAGGTRIGAGHESDYSVSLPQPASGTEWIDLSVPVPGPGDPDVCLLAATPAPGGGPGAYSLAVSIPDGEKRAAFVVQGINLGDCPVDAVPRNAAIGASTRDLTVVQHAIRIAHLQRAFKPHDPDDPFEVQVGSSQGRRLIRRQRRISDLPVTVCSTNPIVGLIVGYYPPEMQCKTVTIKAGESSTPAVSPSEDANALAFSPEDAGTTVVSASATDLDNGLPYIVAPRGEVPIEVAPAVAELRPDTDLGSGLEAGYALYLTKRLDTATDFTLSVDSSYDYCDLWDESSGTAKDSLSLHIPAGGRRKPVTILGQAFAYGTCRIVIDVEPGGEAAVGGSQDLEVIVPRLRIADLAGSLSVFDDAGDKFVVRLKADAKTQSLRSDAALLDVEVCSGDPDVVEFSYQGGPRARCVTATVKAGDQQTALGDLVAHPVNPGEKIPITATATGFLPGEDEITVRSGAVHIHGPSKLGRDLFDAYQVRLSHSPGSDLDVAITAFLATVEGVPLPAGNEPCLVSDVNNPTPVASILATIPAGTRNHSVSLHGVRVTGDDGVCQLHAEVVAPDPQNWAADSRRVAVVTPALRISSLDTSTYVGAADADFNVDVGVAGPQGQSFQVKQPFSAGTAAATRTLEVCSENDSIVEIIGNAPGGSDPLCREPEIPEGEATSREGDLLARAAGDGVVDLSIERKSGAPDFHLTRGARRTVTVTTVSLSFPQDGAELGSGLMETFKVKASKTLSEDHMVSLTTSTPQYCLLAADETTMATDTLTVTIKKGKKQATFALHGLALVIEGQSQQCALTASEPDFGITPGYFQVTPAAGKLADLKNSFQIDGNDDGFKVVLGTKKTKNNGSTVIGTTQKVRIKTATEARNLLVEVCSSNDGVVALKLRNELDSAAGECRWVRVEEGRNSSRISSGLDDTRLRAVPTGFGDAEIYLTGETIPDTDLMVTDLGWETVTVTGETLNWATVGAKVGKGLQSGAFAVEASHVPVAGLPVRITSLTPSYCLVAATAAGPGAATADITLTRPSKQGGVYVQGVQAGECQLQATTDDPIYDPFLAPLASTEVAAGSVQIVGLPGSVDVTTAPTFEVQVGVSDDQYLTLTEIQQVACGAANDSLDVTVASSDTNIAELDTNAVTGAASVVVTIGCGASDSTSNGLTLAPVAVGDTTISAAVTGFEPIDLSEKLVSIVPNNPICGLGFEIGPVLLAIFALRRRRTRRV